MRPSATVKCVALHEISLFTVLSSEEPCGEEVRAGGLCRFFSAEQRQQKSNNLSAKRPTESGGGDLAGVPHETQSLAHLRTCTTYYSVGYLIQTHLNIERSCGRTSMQRIRDRSLFDLCPELGERERERLYWDEWAKQVVALRYVLQDPK